MSKLRSEHELVSKQGLQGPSMWKLRAKPPSGPSSRNLHSWPTLPPTRPGPCALIVVGSIKLLRLDMIDLITIWRFEFKRDACWEPFFLPPLLSHSLSLSISLFLEPPTTRTICAICVWLSWSVLSALAYTTWYVAADLGLIWRRTRSIFVV